MLDSNLIALITILIFILLLISIVGLLVFLEAQAQRKYEIEILKQPGGAELLKERDRLENDEE